MKKEATETSLPGVCLSKKVDDILIGISSNVDQGLELLGEMPEDCCKSYRPLILSSANNGESIEEGEGVEKALLFRA